MNLQVGLDVKRKWYPGRDRWLSIRSWARDLPPFQHALKLCLAPAP
jgi:hypothetical protein